MHKLLSLAWVLTLLSTHTLAGSAVSVKDNANIALMLAKNNYNRIVVKEDKIVEAVFPEQAMAIKRDEHDGSVYVWLTSPNPFTLFLTTEKGAHFSATLSGEESLGKTIELVALKSAAAKKTIPNPPGNSQTITPAAVPEAILAMLSHMEHQKPFADVKVIRQFGKAERWARGLTLLPKATWDGNLLKGEVIELYNGGKEPLELTQSWFAKEGTLAIKFAKTSLKPGEHTLLYRVQDVNHG
jgi:conjugal transfer pilus assembly protein TraK